MLLNNEAKIENILAISKRTFLAKNERFGIVIILYSILK